MVNVYLSFEYLPYEGAELIGVFDNEHEAVKCCKKVASIASSVPWDYYVEEWRVGTTAYIKRIEW